MHKKNLPIQNQLFKIQKSKLYFKNHTPTKFCKLKSYLKVFLQIFGKNGAVSRLYPAIRKQNM